MTRIISAKEYQAILAKTKSPRVKNYEKTIAGKRKFDSKLEAAVWALYEWEAKAGLIKNMMQWPTVHMTEASVKWKVDMCYIRRGEMEFAEAKGMESSRYRVLKTLWREYGPGPLHIWKGSYKKPVLVETIWPKKD